MTFTRDDGLGVFAIALAAAYHQEADGIQRSLLADAVGADGVPKALAIGLGLAGLMLIVKSRLRPAITGDDLPLRAHLKAAGLLAGLATYVAIIPILGYVVGVALLIAGVAAYAGARPGPAMAATAVLGAGVFWVLFVKVLRVPMPRGILDGLLA